MELTPKKKFSHIVFDVRGQNIRVSLNNENKVNSLISFFTLS